MFQVKPQNTIRKLKKRIVKLKSIKKLQKLKCQELPLFYSKGSKLPLRTIPSFYLFSWCLNFVQRHSFHTVLVESPKTMRKLPLSTKCSHQEIRRNYVILRSVSLPDSFDVPPDLLNSGKNIAERNQNQCIMRCA